MVYGPLTKIVKITFFEDLIYAYATQAPSAVGGAERQQWLLARGLAAAGWQVSVGVRTGLRFGQRMKIDGVEFIGCRQGHFIWDWYRFLALERPHWCYWRCATHLLGPVVALARVMGVRTIFSVAFDRDVNIRQALLRRRHWWPLYALGLLWTDRILAQNQKQFVALLPRLRAKAYVVPSINPECQTTNPHPLRPKYVAWVAMLREHKRPDLLIEIARKAPDIQFVVCGGVTTFTAIPGYSEQSARSLCDLPNVEWRKQVPSEQAANVIANAALFLSTSDEEGFPNTFLQAWAAGTPVVSLRVDPDHVIERYSLGKISLTVEQAIYDMRTLLDSEEEREAISRRARDYVVKNHAAAAVTKIFECGIVGVSHKPGRVRSPNPHPL